MKRFTALFKKDLSLAKKDLFVLLEVAAALFFVVVLLILPEEISETKSSVNWYEDKEAEEITDYLIQTKPEGRREEKIKVASLDEMFAMLDADRKLRGFHYYRDENNGRRLDVYLQGNETERFANLTRLVFEDIYFAVDKVYQSYLGDEGDYKITKMEYLREGLIQDPPLNQYLLPIFISFSTVMFATLIMAMLLVDERTNGTQTALRVTPIKTWQFISCKLLLILLLNVLTASIVLLPIQGWTGYLPALMLILLGTAVFSSLGVMIGSFAKTLIQVMVAVILVLVIGGLPLVLYFSPGYSIAFLEFFPSYHVVFGISEAFDQLSTMSQVWFRAVVLACYFCVFYPLSICIFSRQMQKGV